MCRVDSVVVDERKHRVMGLAKLESRVEECHKLVASGHATGAKAGAPGAVELQALHDDMKQLWEDTMANRLECRLAVRGAQREAEAVSAYAEQLSGRCPASVTAGPALDAPDQQQATQQLAGNLQEVSMALDAQVAELRCFGDETSAELVARMSEF